ncbi:hypothetical protein Tco_0430073, partial [Tanacetum coccineum]
MRARATCGHECSSGAAPTLYTAACSQLLPTVPSLRKLDPFRNLSGKLSSPAVQQLWTLYPGKQTANL